MNSIDATIAYRVGELERDMQSVNRKLDRLIWAIVSLTITIAASTVVFAITTVAGATP